MVLGVWEYTEMKITFKRVTELNETELTQEIKAVKQLMRTQPSVGLEEKLDNLRSAKDFLLTKKQKSTPTLADVWPVWL